MRKNLLPLCLILLGAWGCGGSTTPPPPPPVSPLGTGGSSSPDGSLMFGPSSGSPGVNPTQPGPSDLILTPENSSSNSGGPGSQDLVVPPPSGLSPGTTLPQPDGAQFSPSSPDDEPVSVGETPPAMIAVKRTAGDDWPSFLGPTGDSKSRETGIVTKWTNDQPRIVWQKKLGTSYGIGAVSQGRYFQFDRFEDKARVTCVESETGRFLWRFEYPTDYEDYYGYNNGPRCSPVVDGDRVYVLGVEGMLHCLNAVDGRLVWKVDTQEKFGVVQNFFGVGSTPAVEGDLLVVMIGGSPPGDSTIGAGALDRVQGNGTGIVAFDKHSGEVKYSLSDELASYASMKLATINGRRWGFAFARGGLVGFDPIKGKQEFHYPWRAPILESVNASVPVVVGDEVLISETYGPGASLLKVRPGGYDVVWSDDPEKRDKALQTHWNTPVYHDGYVYGSSGRHSNNAELRCVEWKTGQVMWSEPELTRSSLLYVDGHFVCLSEDGVLRLIKANPEKYDQVAELILLDEVPAEPNPLGFGPAQLLRPPAWAAPILSHGLLYVRGDDRVVCLDLIPQQAE